MAKKVALDTSWKEPIRSYDETVLGGFEVVLAMRGRCNYDCHYCIAQYGPPSREPAYYDLEWLRAFYQGLQDIEEPGRRVFVVTSVECGVSEPTIHPQIRDVLELATQFGAVTMPSNNSMPPDRWAPREHPERLAVAAAVHPRGEADLDGYVARLKATQAAGVHIHPMLIAHPLNIPKIERYRDLFTEHGFKFTVRPFRGPYEDRFYPRDYTDAERRAVGILRDEKEKSATVPWNKRMVIPSRDFYGIPCYAGYRLLFVRPPSILQRCLYVKSPIEAPRKKATPCPLHGCPCGAYLEEFNRWGVLFWNGWRKAASWPLIPFEADAKRDLYQEYHIKQEAYWNLMRRYGKLDEEGRWTVGTGLPQDPHKEAPLEGTYGPPA